MITHMYFVVFFFFKPLKNWSSGSNFKDFKCLKWWKTSFTTSLSFFKCNTDSLLFSTSGSPNYPSSREPSSSILFLKPTSSVKKAAFSILFSKHVPQVHSTEYLVNYRRKPSPTWKPLLISRNAYYLKSQN